MWRASIPGALLCAPPTTHMSRLRVATCALVGRVTILSPLPMRASNRILAPVLATRYMATCTPAGPADYVKLQPINTVQSIPTKSANTILLGSVKSVATRSTHNVDGAHHTANDFHSAGTCLLWQSPPPADVITRPPNNRVNTLT